MHPSEESKELRIATRKQRLKTARNLVKRYANTDDESMVDELTRDRGEGRGFA